MDCRVGASLLSQVFEVNSNWNTMVKCYRFIFKNFVAVKDYIVFPFYLIVIDRKNPA